MKPIAIDLFCGLGGWTEGLLATGYEVVGFDIERHAYGDKRYPAQLVLQDIRTIDGARFKDAALIVASPPCQRYSYMAMPWTRAKEMQAKYEASVEARNELNELFNQCFRIQREASAAAGRHIPMVVENVKGAQKWVGPAKWHYGSFYLWGDVPALMPVGAHLKVPSVDGGRRTDPGKGARFTSREGRDESVKLGAHGSTVIAKGRGPRNHASGSIDRKQASAEIAKIPLPLAKHIGEVYR